jgi:uncharacterized protein YciI
MIVPAQALLYSRESGTTRLSHDSGTIMHKKILVLLLAAVTSIAAAAENSNAAHTPPAPNHMKQYFFVLLRNGPDRTQSEKEADKIQEGHMAHIRDTAQAGKLQIAGPFDDENGEWRGILIYDVATIGEARALCDADPAVKAGRLVCDIHGWWAQQGATLK